MEIAKRYVKEDVKEQLRLMGVSTAKAITSGEYFVGDTRVEILDNVKKMISNTTVYKSNVLEKLDDLVKNEKMAKITVTTNDTVEAVLGQVKNFGSSCALNFASAKNPGGGFLTGANAQEEAICRRTTLYGSLMGQTSLYNWSRMNLNNGLYSTWAIYSPFVNVIRDKSGEFVSELVECSMITSPAPNKGVYKQRSGRDKDVSAALYERCKLILEVAALNGEKNLVLGAFGCGVFKNDPKEVAMTFRKLLVNEKMAYYFDNIEFAILGKETGKNYVDFYNTFRSIR